MYLNFKVVMSSPFSPCSMVTHRVNPRIFQQPLRRRNKPSCPHSYLSGNEKKKQKDRERQGNTSHSSAVTLQTTAHGDVEIIEDIMFIIHLGTFGRPVGSRNYKPGD